MIHLFNTFAVALLVMRAKILKLISVIFSLNASVVVLSVLYVRSFTSSHIDKSRASYPVT